MKRKTNLYKEILDINNIINIYKKVIKTTKNKNKSSRYDNYRSININNIYRTLKNKNYNFFLYSVFTIYEPKKREIVSLNLETKVINHLVSEFILIPSLTPCLLDCNTASRKGKGTSEGLRLYYKYRNIMNKKYKEYYILKCDIKKYFYSIDHDILKSMIERKIKDKEALEIVFKIIDSYKEGICIGAMSSQIFAIFYLHSLDLFIKEKLKIKYYLRYQDDFILFSSDKKYLLYCLKEIKKFLYDLKLELNNKTMIYKNKDRISFLGRRKDNTRSKSVINGKLNKRKKLYENNKINIMSYLSSIMSYRNN